MDEDDLRRFLQAEAMGLARDTPALDASRAWHEARRQAGQRLHRRFNLIGWALRAAALLIVVLVAWLEPRFIPAALAPLALLLWCSADLVRRAPKAS
ncbi:MAG TPA: hypothetical protein VGB54_04645 [Allosphingosinicella sp.]|jgi:Flp pilus assembly protein TadB